MDKSQRKATTKKIRQEQQRKKQQRMRIIIWATVVCFIALIVAAILLKPEPKPLAIDYNEVPTIGSATAPVKIVEFGDYECPACQAFSTGIYPQLKADFIDTEKASFSYMNYTIISPNGGSLTAALAAQAVYHQDKDAFWPYYKILFENQGAERSNWATTDFLVELAKQADLGIDYDKLREDIDNRTYEDEVKEQTALANRNQFNVTPTILINGERVDSSLIFDYEKLKAEIEKALETASQTSEE